MKTARTACAVLTGGWDMPNALDTSIVKPLMTGKVTSPPPHAVEFYLLLNGPQPCDVTVGAVNGETEEFAVELLGLRLHGRGG